MRYDDSGAFTLDFIAAYALFAVLITCVFFLSTNSVAGKLTNSYTLGSQDAADIISGMLACSEGYPADWHKTPMTAANATSIGLSAGKPCILSKDKVIALGFLNETSVREKTGLRNDHGIKIEIRSKDGMFVSAGYDPEDAIDVCVSSRIVSIREPEGTYRDAVLCVYIWREHVGTEKVS